MRATPLLVSTKTTFSLSTQSFLKIALFSSGAWWMRTATSCQNGKSGMGAASRTAGRSQNVSETNLGIADFMVNSNPQVFQKELRTSGRAIARVGCRCGETIAPRRNNPAQSRNREGVTAVLVCERHHGFVGLHCLSLSDDSVSAAHSRRKRDRQ